MFETASLVFVVSNLFLYKCVSKDDDADIHEAFDFHFLLISILCWLFAMMYPFSFFSILVSLIWLFFAAEFYKPRAVESKLFVAERVLIDSLVKEAKVEQKKIGKIGTLICVNSNSIKNGKVIVLLHGAACAKGHFSTIVDDLSYQFEVVYVLDWRGIGSSEKKKFTPRNYDTCRDWYIEAIEEWRKEIGLENFVFLGHSLGGLLSFEYAEKYPNRVTHLILASPAALPSVDNEKQKKIEKRASPMLRFIVEKLWSLNFTPMDFFRYTGPFSRIILSKLLVRRASRSPETSLMRPLYGEDGKGVLTNYTFYLWWLKPSGEYCINYFLAPFVDARRPLEDRIYNNAIKSKLSIIWGERGNDWMHESGGGESSKRIEAFFASKGATNSKSPLKSPRRRSKDNHKDRFTLSYVKNAGHQLFLDNPKEFVEHVVSACNFV